MKLYCIKERFNPQFKEPYYKALGQLTKKEIKKYEQSNYGSNYIISFSNIDDYLNKCKELNIKE